MQTAQFTVRTRGSTHFGFDPSTGTRTASTTVLTATNPIGTFGDPICATHLRN